MHLQFLNLLLLYFIFSCLSGQEEVKIAENAIRLMGASILELSTGILSLYICLSHKYTIRGLIRLLIQLEKMKPHLDI